MKIQKTLQGKPKGTRPLDDLLDYLQQLSSDTFSLRAGGYSASGVIVELWHFDGESFDVRFSDLAPDLLQAADDHHREMVAALFHEIG